VSDVNATEKRYTFRASEDLAPRTREAFRTWRDLLEEDDVGGSAALRDAMTGFCLAVFRRTRALDQFDNQSALFRTTLELFVEATERAVENREFVRAYEEWARADEEGAAVRTGALAAAADRWAGSSPG
jgi:hypothetical protein